MNPVNKPLNLFISYSHIDEFFFDELKKHLITLKRNGVINEWHDRKLVSGDELDNEIKKHLGNSDIVVFLISVDFLNSWYCYEVELQQTLERLHNNEVRVVPIVVRPCKWTDSKLGKYVAATKDGKAVAKYDNQDEAWVEVVDSIEDSCKKYLQSKPKETEIIANEDININSNLKEDFKEFLKDTGVVFQHGQKDNVVLEDIFVFPDLKNLKSEYDEIEKTIHSIVLTESDNLADDILILGDDQIGKTSLAKFFFSNLLSSNFLPLYCVGDEINSTNVNRLLNRLLEKQYDGIDESVGLKKVLIIDDFHKIRLNIRHLPKFFEYIKDTFNNTILLSNTTIRFDEHRYVVLSNFIQYEILPFGHLRRGELIDKWNCIGNGETIEIAELQKANDMTTHHVDAIIRKNIIPPKPFYILSTLQLLNSSIQSDYSLTSYGHCYQSLIQNALVRAKIKVQEFDLFINYLTELAYFVFNSGSNKIDELELESFQNSYSEMFLIDSHSRILDALLKSGILKKGISFYRFNYRYIYYFYVAKYLSEHIQEEEIKKKIEYLSDNIHTEKNANIVIFLVHHSKDRQIIDEILFRALAVFEGFDEAKLDLGETKYLSKFIGEIPQLVAEHRNPEKEREKRLKLKDKIDDDTNDYSDIEEVENDKSIFAEINRSLRIIETIGQILRNRHGSLAKDDLIDLTKAACSSGLKFLSFYLNTTRSEETEITTIIENVLKKNTSLTDERLSSVTKKFFLMLCYGTSYGVIKRIVNSLGSDKLIAIFDDIRKTSPEYPTIQLICIAIKLEFSKEIPKSEIEKLYNSLRKNPFTQRLLQEMIVQHLYLNVVDYRDKQWIASKTGIPMKTQRLIQSKGQSKEI